MPTRAAFPTALHEQMAAATVAFFQAQPATAAVLLVNSCARGTATPASDLDIAVLVSPATPPAASEQLLQEWWTFAHGLPLFQQFKQLGRFTGVHLDITDGQIVPEVWDDGGGPDGFELQIGNHFAYGVALWEQGPTLADLRARWLPYYPEPLRQQRLAMARAACEYDLEHVPFYVGRGLYFQAFDRLYKALQEFLQALFIQQRRYPLAYNKWIYEQVGEWLGLPQVYTALTEILALPRLDGPHLLAHGERLRALLDQWVPGPASG